MGWTEEVSYTSPKSIQLIRCSSFRDLLYRLRLRLRLNWSVYGLDLSLRETSIGEESS